MVEKCYFLFSRISHRDPKVEPAGLGSGAAPRVWRRSTVACDFTSGPDPSVQASRSEPHFSENKSILFPSNSVNKGRYMSQYTNCALCIWSFIIFKIV